MQSEMLGTPIPAILHNSGYYKDISTKGAQVSLLCSSCRQKATLHIF
jgi:hypothetical protein